MYAVRDDLDRLGADEVQAGRIDDRERRQDRDYEIQSVHTPRHARPRKPDAQTPHAAGPTRWRCD